MCVWLQWVFIALHGLSLVAARGGSSLVVGGGLLLLWSTGSRHTDSVVVVNRLSCSVA